MLGPVVRPPLGMLGTVVHPPVGILGPVVHPSLGMLRQVVRPPVGMLGPVVHPPFGIYNQLFLLYYVYKFISIMPFCLFSFFLFLYSGDESEEARVCWCTPALLLHCPTAVLLRASGKGIW